MGVFRTRVVFRAEMGVFRTRVVLGQRRECLGQELS